MTVPREPGVQSVERVLAVLEHLAEAGGPQPLSGIARATGLPAPTIHRMMRTLVGGGFVRQEPSRRYALGPRLIRMGDAARRLLGAWTEPALRELVMLTGETANVAVLDGDGVVYVAQVPGRHSMRTFTEPGRRVLPHCTAVGKALLAGLPDEQVRAVLARTGMPAHTRTTITDPDALLAELAAVRERGYAVDEGEQEVGVRCVAVAVPDAPVPATISVSGPRARVTGRAVPQLAGVLLRVAAALGEEISGQPALDEATA